MKDVLNDMTIDDLKNVDNKVQRAMYFAIIAHKGQVRKGTPNVPMVMHPIRVANIVRIYGGDKSQIAAAYLHDVVEDTKYTIDDIDKYFGSDIRNLVSVATEPDKSLSWEIRKQHTINIVKELTFREKLVIIADKINNIEDLEQMFGEKGFMDFSAFKKGADYQEWYYRNIYKSLINNEDPNLPILKRLERGINNTFGRDIDDYFGNQKKLGIK